MLGQILSKGYFPPELPPPFDTTQLGGFVQSLVDEQLDKYMKSAVWTAPAIHSRARAGTLRRIYSVPNPTNFLALAIEVARNWDRLAHIAADSDLSESRPIHDFDGRRSIGRTARFKDLPRHRAATRANARYIVRADVSRCYPSIYTHAIPWAIHGKEKAKKNQSQRLLGNRIDKRIRQGQSGQTVGIPIGPDTSYLVAEIILSAVDRQLTESIGPINGFRYVDDYELAAEDAMHAERYLTALEGALAQYELSLNPAKTEIIRLPAPLDEPWVRQLSGFALSEENSRKQYFQLQRHFDAAYELAREIPTQSVLKYALRTLHDAPVTNDNWPFLQNLVLQCCMSEPGLLDVALALIDNQRSKSHDIDKEAIASTLNRVTYHHGRVQHGHEVAWAAWGLLHFDLKIEERAARVMAQMNDPFVALLLFDALERGNVEGSIDVTGWEELVKAGVTNDSSWLLIYERSLGSRFERSFDEPSIETLPAGLFQDMATEGVSFYDFDKTDPVGEDEEPFELEFVSDYGEPQANECDDDIPL